MDLWNQIKKIFKEAEESSASQPVLKGAIERTDLEEAAYIRWKLSAPSSNMLNWIRQHYGQYQIQVDSQAEAIDFLNTPSSKGFVIYAKKVSFNPLELQYLFDYLKEKAQDFSYRKYVSDFKTYTNKQQKVETIFRHYLKPPLHRGGSGTKVNQLYGNILIELLTRNEKIINLKFRCNSYYDHKYKPALDFEDLMDRITRS